jgi:hypothetical protein
MGVCCFREVESPTPVTTDRGSGRGASARSGHEGAHCRVIGGGPRGRCGGTGGRDRGTPEPLRKRKQGFSNLR